jgi:hypothetical protein
MDSIIQDLRQATRWFVQRPGFTAIIVSTLALGIGANSALFSVVNGILLRELPYDGAERLVSICEAHRPNVECVVASTPNAEDWLERGRSLEDLGIWRSWTRTLKGDDGAEGVSGGLATPGFFSTLRLQPALGRLFVPEDLEEGRNHVVVLNHDYWSSRFGQDPAIVGRNITLDSESYEVVGVLRPNHGAPLIAGGTRRELWTPLHFDPRDPSQRSWRGFFVVGRLAPLTTLDRHARS